MLHHEDSSNTARIPLTPRRMYHTHGNVHHLRTSYTTYGHRTPPTDWGIPH